MSAAQLISDAIKRSVDTGGPAHVPDTKAVRDLLGVAADRIEGDHYFGAPEEWGDAWHIIAGDNA
jgi:hypothetical protein